MRTSRPQRLKFDYLGCHRYSLTFRTNLRAKVFVDHEIVHLVLSQFLRAVDEERFSLLAYCFMPDHVHFLVQGNSETSDGCRLIKLGKQYALWQPWGFERVLRNDEATFTVARYIVENPVRAGLSASVAEYPFVGSRVCELKDLIGSLPT